MAKRKPKAPVFPETILVSREDGYPVVHDSELSAVTYYHQGKVTVATYQLVSIDNYTATVEKNK